ncbi:Cyclin-P4-1 [Hibiscus syriacus]|uniref:Cyclin-P4-1 n=1 Tax=Hibiscus syriacus TaxID=106335 RepID=A0A6A2WGZ1_HIBSY|nr:Cyclin-P4-1 [Hibiscus syriacus]
MSSLLERVAESNDHYRLFQSQKMSVFHGTTRPTISIRNYIGRIFKYANCSTSCFVVAYVCLDWVNSTVTKEVVMHSGRPRSGCMHVGAMHAELCMYVGAVHGPCTSNWCRSPWSPGDMVGHHGVSATKLLGDSAPQPSFNPLLPHACVASIAGRFLHP